VAWRSRRFVQTGVTVDDSGGPPADGAAGRPRMGLAAGLRRAGHARVLERSDRTIKRAFKLGHGAGCGGSGGEWLDEHAFWVPSEVQVAECTMAVFPDEDVDLAGAG
jgi:hypothetical protein